MRMFYLLTDYGHRLEMCASRGPFTHSVTLRIPRRPRFARYRLKAKPVLRAWVKTTMGRTKSKDLAIRRRQAR